MCCVWQDSVQLQKLARYADCIRRSRSLSNGWRCGEEAAPSEGHKVRSAGCTRGVFGRSLRPIWSLEVALLKNLLLDLVDCERGAANLSLLWLSCSASPAISSHLLGLRQWRPWRQIERFNKELNAKFKFASKVLERLQSVNKMREEPKHKNRCVWIYTYNHIYLCVWL